MEQECVLCGNYLQVKPRGSPKVVECKTCGTYTCDSFVADKGSRVGWEFIQGAVQEIEGHKEIPRHLFSGLTRDAWERGYIVSVTEGSLLELLQSASIPDGPLESMDEILLYVARKAQSADEYQTLENTDYPIAFAKHPEEFRYLLSNLAERNYIETPGTMGRSREFRLTPEGWERVAELRRSQRDSSQAFVAMWFNEELDPVWVDGFEPALEETGYRPIRIDRVEHSGKIDDRIVAEIRRSGLLVADFTGDRGGVYFEAGFAMGLGIPVIWTCRQGNLDKVHFDTRQFNHIVWTDAADLKKRLIDRIEATLPNRVRRTSE